MPRISNAKWFAMIQAQLGPCDCDGSCVNCSSAWEVAITMAKHRASSCPPGLSYLLKAKKVPEMPSITLGLFKKPQFGSRAALRRLRKARAAAK